MSGLPLAPAPRRTPVPATALRLWLGVVASLSVASPVLAQDGMRYLSWAGKPAHTGPAIPPQMQQVAGSRYPSIGSGAGRPSRYSPSVASGALTPANAWMNQAPSQPQMMPAPASWGGPVVQPYAPPAYAPPAFAQPSFAPRPDMPQPAMSPQPIFIQPDQNAQPMAAPHFQQQQRRLQQQQPAAGPAWTQPGYAPRVFSQTPTPQQFPPQYQPQYQPEPEPQPQPQAQAQFQPRQVPQSAPQWATPQQQAFGAGSPDQTPAWAGANPTSGEAPVADPMAPRRDAPIFRIQRAQAAPSPQMQSQAQPQQQPSGQPQQMASAEGPARGSARYYSVHRAAGQEPDPTAMPESVYAVIPETAFLDAARTDLAEPPPPPIQTRTVNGRVQAINQGGNPGLP